jgi:hypothetical protein
MIRVLLAIETSTVEERVATVFYAQCRWPAAAVAADYEKFIWPLSKASFCVLGERPIYSKYCWK